VRLEERRPTASDRQSSGEAGLRGVEVNEVGTLSANNVGEGQCLESGTGSRLTDRVPREVSGSCPYCVGRKIALSRAGDRDAPAAADLVSRELRDAPGDTVDHRLGNVENGELGLGAAHLEWKRTTSAILGTE
jgi:hypothetical protein